MSSSSIQNNQLQQWKDEAIASPGISEFIQEILALTKRLFIQLQRRPSTLAAGIIQPLMWLILFGALFQNVPQGLFGDNVNYGQFIGAGIIVFTAFGGALNAGLPVMFDREFGFLNRLLVAPLVSRFSIVIASALFIATMSLIQTAAIVVLSAFLGTGLPSISGLALMVLIILMLVLGVTALSLGIAFALPGHIELIAVIFVANLPLLFASTALVPLSFMPRWLSTIASLNPLSYAIEPIRYLYLHNDWSLSSIVMQTAWGEISMGMTLILGVVFCVVSLGITYPLINRRIA
ncbi:MAG: ABC transporter permease [Cyanobacteria bacterium P01_F01_bin.116]